MLASCWVARKIFLSEASASSRACTLDSRPTTNGVIMYGKMTTSRMGIIGNFLVSNFSLDVVTESPKKLLSCLFHHGERRAVLLYHLLGYFEFLHFLLAREMVHQIEHQFFQNHAQ